MVLGMFMRFGVIEPKLDQIWVLGMAVPRIPRNGVT